MHVRYQHHHYSNKLSLSKTTESVLGRPHPSSSYTVSISVSRAFETKCNQGFRLSELWNSGAGKWGPLLPLPPCLQCNQWDSCQNSHITTLYTGGDGVSTGSEMTPHRCIVAECRRREWRSPSSATTVRTRPFLLVQRTVEDSLVNCYLMSIQFVVLHRSVF